MLICLPAGLRLYCKWICHLGGLGFRVSLMTRLNRKDFNNSKTGGKDMGTKKRQYHRWSADKIKLLKKLYHNQPAQSVADILGRSTNTVRMKAISLGIQSKMRKLWTKKEDAMLRKLYRSSTQAEMVKKIGRSYASIQARKIKLGLRTEQNRWSQQELNLLRKLYPTHTAQEVAERLGRPAASVQRKVFFLRIRKMGGILI
jgi:hypothetical protein